MVFESISKWLTNLGKTTKSAVDTATSPLTDISKKMVKSMPLMSSHEDIWVLVQDHIRIQEYLAVANKLTKQQSAIYKRHKISAAQIKQLADGLAETISRISLEVGFGSLVHTHRHLIDTRQKNIKSLWLKKTDLEFVQLSTNQMQQQLKNPDTRARGSS